MNGSQNSAAQTLQGTQLQVSQLQVSQPTNEVNTTGNGKFRPWRGWDCLTTLPGNRGRNTRRTIQGKPAFPHLSPLQQAPLQQAPLQQALVMRWVAGLRGVASIVAIVSVWALSGCNGGSGGGAGGVSSFQARGTFQIPAPGQAAEIVAAANDGNTLIYTDAGSGRVGFVNIADLSAISQSGAVDAGGEPTSVAITRDNQFALVVVRDPNRLLVINIATRAIVSTRNLNGQPDSIVVSPDGRFAAIAIENERPDENATLPVAPPGLLTIVRTVGAPSAWTLSNVNLTGLAGLRFPNDPEPEFVDIDRFNRAAVTLQENNAIVIVNLESGSIIRSFSAGTTTHPADLQDNGTVSLTDTLTNARREPDGIAWTPQGNLLVANEGDGTLSIFGL